MSLLPNVSLRWNDADYKDWGALAGSGGASAVQAGFNWSIGTCGNCGTVTGNFTTPANAFVRTVDSRFNYAGGYYAHTVLAPGSKQPNDCCSEAIAAGYFTGAGEGSEEWWLVPFKLEADNPFNQTGWLTSYQGQQTASAAGWGGQTHASFDIGGNAGKRNVFYRLRSGQMNEPNAGQTWQYETVIPILGDPVGTCFPSAAVPAIALTKWYWLLIHQIYGSGCPTNLNPAGSPLAGNNPGGWNGNGTLGTLELWLKSEDDSDFTKLYTNTTSNDALMNYRTQAVHPNLDPTGGTEGTAISTRANGHAVGIWNVTNGCPQETGTAGGGRSNTNSAWTYASKAILYSHAVAFTRTSNMGPLTRHQSLADAKQALGITGGPAADPDISATLPALAGGKSRYGVTTELPNTYFMAANQKRSSTVTVTEEVDIDTIWIRLSTAVGTGTEKLIACVYADDGTSGIPHTLKIQAAEKVLTVPYRAGWLQRTVTPVRLSAGQYEVGTLVRNGVFNSMGVTWLGQVLNGGGFIDTSEPYDSGLKSPAGTESVYNFQGNFVIEGTPTGGGGVGGSGDTTPPTVSGIQTLTSGAAIVLICSEPLDTGSVPATARFTATVNGSAATVTSVQLQNDRLELGVLPNVRATDTTAPTLAYTAAANPIRDVANNNLASFGATTVLNLVSPATSSGRFRGIPGVNISSSRQRIVNLSKRTQHPGKGGGI